ncbi:uncharacterized protein TM35_000032370 [Trypanosoma theileri]|uniref:DUF6787 domain-containing protein n=1 Tax=Trypanosoma theileri TaxID=67003 RepID=A0A1X0P6B8_9TRYP|nr:uncharacterized protein TM35_000032370 [Trypanosoma theileri]ORC92484.1 hypothetical protein TM35_000032370 [Trypanosoma theileri]
MQRRLSARTAGQMARFPCKTSARKCSTTNAQASATNRITGSLAGESTTATTARGPMRKDWRTHKEVVYVKGVPMKGSLFKLPLKEQILICLIFSITGSAAVYIVRPIIRSLVKDGFLGLPEDSGWINGPWLYRFLYIAIMYPAYSLMLLTIGSIFGRRVWFSFMIHKMWSRFLTKNASKRLEYILDLQHY